MPELILHFAIPFSLSAPILGVRRAFIVGLIAILPDIDALARIHRSFTHSMLFLLPLSLLAIVISAKLGKGIKMTTASALALLSHPILDLFHSLTPILYPISDYSYHVSVKMRVVISEEIAPAVAAALNFERISSMDAGIIDAPIFTDVGFSISALLITFPLIHQLIDSSKHTGLARALNDKAKEVRGDPNSSLFGDELSIIKDEVTVLIPTLNEEGAIGSVIQEVRNCGYRNVLVVDGYSGDRTVEIARNLGAQVIYQIGSGKAMAVKTGIDAVKTPYVLVMDGDGTYDPRDIEKMLETAVKYRCDEVIGYRVNRENIPLLHRLGNRVISTLISLLMGQRIKDPCSGIYLLGTDFAKQLEITATGFDLEAEIICQSLAHGKVAEVPVNYRRRIGKPKLSTWKAGFRILLTAVKIAWLYNPVLLFSSIGSIFGIIGLAILIWQLYMRYLFGESAWSIGWTWLGLVLLIVGIHAFTIAIISLMLKRMERRLMQLQRER